MSDLHIDDISAAVRSELTRPGGPFETTIEDVLGEQMLVFANRHRSLRDLVDATDRFGDLEFLVLGDQRVSYPEFRARVSATAHRLDIEYDIRAGDRVGILAANRPEWLIGFFAVTSLGGTVAAFNGWWTPDEISHGLELSAPVVVLGDTKRLARLDDHPGLATIPTVDMETQPEFFAADDVDAATPPIGEDAPALILFTSGTTGRPKGALVSHRGMIGFIQGNLYNVAERGTAVMRQMGIDPPAAPPTQPITLATSPLFHVSGLFGSTLMAIGVGGKLVFREGRFDAADVLRLIEQERVTSWSAIGSMGAQLLASEDLATRDTSSLTNLGSGGAPMSPTLQVRLREAFPSAAQSMGMGYGSSESVAVVSSIGGSDFVERPTAAGRINHTFEVEIHDDQGNALPDREEGEVFVRSAYSMLGYWRDPEATEATFSPGRWLAMGDIGHIEDGFLYLNSRARDMILRNGENIYPTEIEHRLEAHPSVAEAAVLGVDHQDMGQEVRAVVVTEPGSTVDTDELRAWCGETLAAYKVPSVWDIGTAPLPRTAAGKLLKRML